MYYGENAAEALKLAGFTLLFVAALSIAMVTIMQAKREHRKMFSHIQIILGIYLTWKLLTMEILMMLAIEKQMYTI